MSLLIFSKGTRYILLNILSIVLLWTTFQSAAWGQLQNGEEENSLPEVLAHSFEERNLNVIPNSFIKIPQGEIDYIIAVDKSRPSLELYHYDGNFHRIKTYLVTTGSKEGNKRREGDFKTPEGIYFFNKIREVADLVDLYGSYVSRQYGIRAFDITFPNPIDRFYKRYGSGIWLHGTDEPDRIGKPRDTRGCVVLRNEDVEELSKIITLYQTPIIISEQMKYVSPDDVKSDEERVRLFVKNWKQNWQNVDIDNYAKRYSHKFFSKGKDLSSWVDFKKNLLGQYISISIDVTDLTIFRANDYFYVQFKQEFLADNYRDFGLKKLYLIEEGESLRIIREEWDELNAPSGNSSNQVISQ